MKEKWESQKWKRSAFPFFVSCIGQCSAFCWCRCRFLALPLLEEKEIKKFSALCLEQAVWCLLCLVCSGQPGTTRTRRLCWLSHQPYVGTRGGFETEISSDFLPLLAALGRAGLSCFQK